MGLIGREADLRGSLPRWRKRRFQRLGEGFQHALLDPLSFEFDAFDLVAKAFACGERNGLYAVLKTPSKDPQRHDRSFAPGFDASIEARDIVARHLVAGLSQEQQEEQQIDVRTA